MELSALAAKAVVLLSLLSQGSALAAGGCPPDGWNAERLGALKSAGFAVADAARRQQLALALVPCLADPDPTLRDGIAFEATSTWLRAGQLDAETRLALLGQLLPAIAPEAADRDGFRQPFSALVLAELARADRKSPTLSPAQRQQLVEAGARYLESLTDYRGYDARQGWRHGVAHGADLLMQLALNESLDQAQLERILAAVQSRIAPPGEHFYIHGEPERLARPVLFAAMRGLQSPAQWSAWFQQVAAPAPLSGWDQAFQSTAGLARRHNTRAFLLVVYSEIRDSRNERLAPMLPAVVAALAAVP